MAIFNSYVSLPEGIPFSAPIDNQASPHTSATGPRTACSFRRWLFRTVRRLAATISMINKWISAKFKGKPHMGFTMTTIPRIFRSCHCPLKLFPRRWNDSICLCLPGGIHGRHQGFAASLLEMAAQLLGDQISDFWPTLNINKITVDGFSWCCFSSMLACGDCWAPNSERYSTCLCYLCIRATSDHIKAISFRFHKPCELRNELCSYSVGRSHPSSPATRSHWKSPGSSNANSLTACLTARKSHWCCEPQNFKRSLELPCSKRRIIKSSNPTPLPFGFHGRFAGDAWKDHLPPGTGMGLSPSCTPGGHQKTAGSDGSSIHPKIRYFIATLWLCQNSYWKWPFIVDFPIKNGDFP